MRGASRAPDGDDDVALLHSSSRYIRFCVYISNHFSWNIAKTSKIFRISLTSTITVVLDPHCFAINWQYCGLSLES